MGGAGTPAEQEPDTEVIQYEGKQRKAHPGRHEIPAHLPVEQVILEVDEPREGLKKIGEEVTETLKYTPASLVRKRVIRPKYATSDDEGLLIADLPPRPIEKGTAEASLLARVLVSKLVDHLPYPCQIAICKRDVD